CARLVVVFTTGFDFW
nr:immunoglobulin heavy chain junction region [Macaca mulatta]MOW86562.1 immunoglobulin heavy chain junction region [Macaca mulatta]MOW86624.1 immunoglobulin heavy chain junction region [Macaca mulatta]MOW86758.1 immunoglobulin heavy chain junction region [Macaca mulatta]MOW86882.1 immunoglobulin heavy chain junction region [Macaca mulatta]